MLSYLSLPSKQNTCAASYFHLWPVLIYHRFPDYLLNVTIYGKQLLNVNYVFLNFSSTCVWNISHSKKNSAIYYHKCTQVFVKGTRHSCQNLSFLDRFSKNIQIPNFVKIRPVGNELFYGGGRTDRQTARDRQT